jgi:3-hydroxyisobutyrate dehydrogenase-like beta-hydroxyacid dehydrogenase
MRIGFIGLGRMGSQMCGHLLKADYAVTAYDVRPEAVQAMAQQGAQSCASPAQAASEADIVFTSLPHPDISRQVIVGEHGILAGITAGALIAETSTVSPGLVQALAPEAARRGVELLDAAVSGGVHGAEAGTLTLMVGGSDAGFARLHPALESFGKNIFHCGGPGMGMLFKVVNNMLSHVNFAALAEAMALGVAAGANPDLLCDVIAVSSGRSAQIEDRLRKHILPGDFTPGMTTDLATKDSVLCLELARQHQVPTFIASAAHHVYEMALGKGYGPLEYASLIKLWEEWMGIEVRSRIEGEDMSG